MSLDHNPAVSPDLLLYEDAVRNGLRTRAELVLANLKEEGVLDDELSAEGGRTTLGCAIILYRAAIESTTNPPAISLPSTTGRQSITLSQESCPRALRTFISVWSQITPAIIALSSEHLEDVRRLLFGMHPLSTTCDPHLEAIVRMLEMVAFVLGTWCMRRDPPAGSHASAPIGSPAPEVDASGCKDEPSSMPRTKRQLRKSENASPSTDRPSKHPRKDPAFRQAILANGKTDDPREIPLEASMPPR
ncbi:hypothetical protein BD309DRAFT_478024 [Dichomitus squalens]|uniref:Uncharacterized protein n=1 Tax=Dichomitus squalens TaxID=114155 RepID=A0A4Q9P2X5_9APHY|nr:hypothetical protein BD309DRAFT_478024 [Dichomitus squalens]TBU57680.1 hypothetical protein BD310DRAFT_536891 [Dichomitus squalens]